MLVEFVPRALRDKIDEARDRVRVMARAITWMEWETPLTEQLVTSVWLERWKRHVTATEERVLARWRRRELTTNEAIEAMDSELRLLAPTAWEIKSELRRPR